MNVEQGRVLMSTRHSLYQEVTKGDDTELPVVCEVRGRCNTRRREQCGCDMHEGRMMKHDNANWGEC